MRKTLALIAGLALSALPSQGAGKPTLSVYTYDSFVSEWGPGPQIERAFEEICHCDLKFTAAGDGAALLARVRLEGSRSEADIVLGLDTSLAQAARETGLFARAPRNGPRLDLPVRWIDTEFSPYDWGYFAFVYDKTRLADPPGSFEELAAAKDIRIVIQDPRSSTPGLGLLLWVKKAYGDRAEEIWEALRPRILTVTKGWSEAYGLFLEGEADMVLSYTTSPAYHLIAEGDDSKAAAPFSEGHYMQIEVAGILKSSRQEYLARQFLDFMISDEIQSIIAVTNWMYPVKIPSEGLPEGFETLMRPERSLLLSPSAAARLRGPALEEWRRALSR